jgi:uncharacterized membrane protein
MGAASSTALESERGSRGARAGINRVTMRNGLATTEGVRARPGGDVERLSKFLGWFSIGLGLAQVTAPGAVARLIGVSDDDRTRMLMRGLGMRELTSGVGILSKPRSAGWVRSRVVGDLMDIALLGKAMADDDNDRGKTLGATVAVLGVTALDVLCSQKLGDITEEDALEIAAVEPTKEQRRTVRRSITVNCTPAEAYAFWHNFENLPRFMQHLESVTVDGDGYSHWKAKAPAGKSVEWDAQLVADRPNEMIAWRSLPGSDVHHEGRVHFGAAPGGRGTEIHVELRYDPPAGSIGATIAKLFREEPSQQVKDDLFHFKQVMEVGEVVMSDATQRRGPHPAQPDR